MLDAIAMERRGIPSAAVGVEKLARTTGRGMARAQGYADLRIATIVHSTGTLAGLTDSARIEEMAAQVAAQVESILLGKP